MMTLGGILVVYIAAMTLVYAFQRRMVFPGPSAEEPHCHRPGKYLVFEAPSGRKVHTVHFPAREGEPTVAVFHGNGETLASTVPLLEVLAREGLGAYGVEYPGYGPASSYSPSESALYEDAQAALDHLEQQMGVSRGQVVLMGRSLGTGVAVEMARRGYGGRMILVSPFTSMPDVAARIFPYLFPRLLMRDRFDNLGKAPRIGIPTLVIHGSEDKLVPMAMGRRLAETIPNARLVVVEGGSHNDLLAEEPDIDPSAVVGFARPRRHIRRAAGRN